MELTAQYGRFDRFGLALRKAGVCAVLLAGWSSLAAADSGKPMTRIQEQEFGTMPDGTQVKLFTLRNEHGMTAKIMSYGAMMTEIQVPDRSGKVANVVLGAERLEDYLNGFPAGA